MPIQIGAKPENDFHTPLGLLSDCHRRIEKFLYQLLAVAEQAKGDPLSDVQRPALDTALRYFRGAAPLHTQDEEASLFPRMRATRDPRAAAALKALERLEADHQVADAAHAEVDRLGREWLDAGRLEPPDAERLIATLRELRELYRRHIAVEDNEVFVLAGSLLPPDQVEALGREMAIRRGLDPDNLLSVSHYQLKKLA